MKYLLVFLLNFFVFSLNAQTLKLKPREADALTGTAFAKAIADSALSLKDREQLIYKEIRNGNVPSFLRKLSKITDSAKIGNETYIITYYVLPDYFCIGSNDDFFYIPMTPILAQKVADLTKCSLPTKRIVDQVYKNAIVKLEPKPISPTKAMTTVPVFLAHSDTVNKQLKPIILKHIASDLTTGNKKDIIISNKIYGEKTDRVVIYGWHKLDGKPIQPVYNKHTHTWADYSHGVRLIQNKVWVNGKKTTIDKVLSDKGLCTLLSDEGVIEKAYYPIFDTY